MVRRDVDRRGEPPGLRGCRTRRAPMTPKLSHCVQVQTSAGSATPRNAGGRTEVEAKVQSLVRGGPLDGCDAVSAVGAHELGERNAELGERYPGSAMCWCRVVWRLRFPIPCSVAGVAWVDFVCLMGPRRFRPRSEHKLN